MADYGPPKGTWENFSPEQPAAIIGNMVAAQTPAPGLPAEIRG